MTDGEPETAVSVSLQKIKSIKSQHKLLLFNFFNFIKSQTCDSFVIHFDGHFAYLKTLDFYFYNPYGLCGRKAILNTLLRSCVKVEVAVLGSPSLMVLMVSVDVRQHLQNKKKRTKRMMIV